MEEKWEELFDLSTGFESTFDSQLEDAPFLLLLGRDLVTTPKFLICVAKGIPCLDESYLNDIIDGLSVSPPLSTDRLPLTSLRWTGGLTWSQPADLSLGCTAIIPLASWSTTAGVQPNGHRQRQ